MSTICHKTMRACVTESMCAPFQGCPERSPLYGPVTMKLVPTAPKSALTDAALLFIWREHRFAYGENDAAVLRKIADAAVAADRAQVGQDDDECIDLAQALEQARAVKIAESVAALPIGGATNNMPTPFQSGYQLACEEIIHRLRTEVWNLCLKPISAQQKGED